MRIDYVRTSLTTLWVLTLGIVSYAVGTTLLGWVVVAALAVAPTLLTRLWARPAPTMSDRIQGVAR